MPWDKISPTPHDKVFTVREITLDYVNSPRWDLLSEGSKVRYLSVCKVLEGLTLYTGGNIFDMKAYKVTYATADYLQRVITLSNRKPATLQFYFAVLSNIFDYACRNGKVYLNPFLKPRIKVQNERDVTWSVEQVNDTIVAATALGFPVLALYILLCYETAQRPWKDLFNLTWNSLKNDDQGGKYFDFEISKTKTHLMLPLSPTTIRALDSLPKTSSYIFVDESGKRVPQAKIYNQFQVVRKKIGLPEGLLIRDLRRTAVTELAERGCTPLEIEAITGWRCPDAVLRRYARVRLKTAQNALHKREQGRILQDKGICTETQNTA